MASLWKAAFITITRGRFKEPVVNNSTKGPDRQLENVDQVKVFLFTHLAVGFILVATRR